MQARITFIAFDHHERLKRASIKTPSGTVQVTWVNLDGDLNWFSSGPLEARRLAVPTIQRIERMTAESCA